MGGQAADLAAVLGGLDRGAGLILQYYDGDPLTTLIFTTGVVAGGGLAVTVFTAQIGGVWRDLDDICSPASGNWHLGLLLRHDTPIRITITVDHTLHNVLPANHKVTATLAHEINVHAIHAKPWLEKLRSNAYLGVQIRAQWRTSAAAGGLLDVNREHDVFGQGLDRAYNRAVENIHGGLPAIHQPPFQGDVRADMVAHLPAGAPAHLLPGAPGPPGVPRFPI